MIRWVLQARVVEELLGAVGIEADRRVEPPGRREAQALDRRFIGRAELVTPLVEWSGATRADGRDCITDRRSHTTRQRSARTRTVSCKCRPGRSRDARPCAGPAGTPCRHQYPRS